MSLVTLAWSVSQRRSHEIKILAAIERVISFLPMTHGLTFSYLATELGRAVSKKSIPALVINLTRLFANIDQYTGAVSGPVMTFVGKHYQTALRLFMRILMSGTFLIKTRCAFYRLSWLFYL